MVANEGHVQIVGSMHDIKKTPQDSEELRAANRTLLQVSECVEGVILASYASFA